MSKIATEQDVYNVGQTGTPTVNKCCTKKRMEALGCTGINGIENYDSNRLVPEGYYQNTAQSFKISVSPGGMRVQSVILTPNLSSYCQIISGPTSEFVKVEVKASITEVILGNDYSTNISRWIVTLSEETASITDIILSDTVNCTATYSDNLSTGGKGFIVTANAGDFDLSVEFSFKIGKYKIERCRINMVR